MQITEEWGLSEDDSSLCHISKERDTQAEIETPTNARIQATLTKRAPRKIPACIVLAHTLNLDFVYILHFVDI